MDKVKVLHVGLDPHLGGIETYLMKISSHIDRNRFQFDFLVHDEEHPCFYEELKAMGCNFHFVRSRRTSYLGNIKDLDALFEKEHYDIVHCHLNSLTYITPALRALKAGSKVIVHSRNAGSGQGSSSALLCALNKYRLPYGKITMAAVSDKAGEWMFGKGKPVIVLNNGLDAEHYQYSEEKRGSMRKEFNMAMDAEVIAHVGAFRPQKNHGFLLDIFAFYSKDHPSSKLLLVGDGELKKEMEEKVETLGLGKQVIFAGQRRDLDYILSGSDKFLFPSLYEGFPNALLEAEASGLLAIASDTITKQACLENSICLSLNASPEEWAKTLATPSLVNRQRFTKVVDDAGFGIGSEMQRLVAVYDKVLGK